MWGVNLAVPVVTHPYSVTTFPFVIKPDLLSFGNLCCGTDIHASPRSFLPGGIDMSANLWQHVEFLVLAYYSVILTTWPCFGLWARAIMRTQNVLVEKRNVFFLFLTVSFWFNNWHRRLQTSLAFLRCLLPDIASCRFAYRMPERSFG